MPLEFGELSKSLGEAWQNISEGWRELLNRSNSALTRFFPRKNANEKFDDRAAFPIWAMLAGEVIDKDKSIIVHLELPGINREDCDIRIDDRTLRICGEKQLETEHVGERYYMMERAYGKFERIIPLPTDVDPESARASLHNGVLKIELAKRHDSVRHRINID